MKDLQVTLCGRIKPGRTLSQEDKLIYCERCLKRLETLYPEQ